MTKEFENTYTKLAEPLRNFIYYKVGDWALAEDLAQESFVKLWKHFSKVTQSSVKSYLYTIANNLVSDHYRKNSVKLRFEQSRNAQSTAATPEDIYREKEFKQQLEKAISGLPEKERVVFLMNRIDKKTYREIAEMLEISPKTVEKRMHKALIVLRKLYSKI